MGYRAQAIRIIADKAILLSNAGYQQYQLKITHITMIVGKINKIRGFIHELKTFYSDSVF